MKPRINALLLVQNNPFPQDFRVRREAYALRDSGLQVAVIAPRGGREAWHEELDGISVYRFPGSRGGTGTLSYIWEFGYSTFVMLLYALFIGLRRGVDVVHAANPPDTLFVIGAVFKAFGKKYVFDQHDLSPETFLSRFQGAKGTLAYNALLLCERASYRLADAVIVTNESYRSTALERGGKQLKDVYIVRNGPPLTWTNSIDRSPAADVGILRIGYIGTIGPQDGVDYWIRAISHIVNTFQRHDIVADIIGDGDAFEHVVKLADNLGVKQYVNFTGRLPEHEAKARLAKCAVFVQPDPMSALNDKSTMNKMMEYMALGKPTVAFDLHETRFSAGQSALYVAPNDERAFAQAVCRLLEDEKLREEMGDIGRRRIREKLAWEYSVPHLVRLYEESLGFHIPQFNVRDTDHGTVE